jgi:hypothetical protein
VVLASITPEGRRVVEKATDRLNVEVFERPGLSGAEVLQLVELLGAVRADLGDAVAQPVVTSQ